MVVLYVCVYAHLPRKQGTGKPTTKDQILKNLNHRIAQKLVKFMGNPVIGKIHLVSTVLKTRKRGLVWPY